MSVVDYVLTSVRIVWEVSFKKNIYIHILIDFVKKQLYGWCCVHVYIQVYITCVYGTKW